MIDPKEVNESLTPEPSEMPEAPLSIHIDAYYKGFHSGITIRGTDNKMIPVSKVKDLIDGLIAQGFMPSWNQDTNMVHTPEKAVVGQPVTPQEPLGVCPDCGAKQLLSKKGNPYCSKKCWIK